MLENKNPSLGRQGAEKFRFVETNSTLSFHPTIDRLTLLNWTRERSLLIDAHLSKLGGK